MSDMTPDDPTNGASVARPSPSRAKRTRQSIRKGAEWSWGAFKRMIHSRSTPHQIALGAAIGIFVAWTPTIGFQMALAVPICLFLKANPLASIPPVWITNPVTAVPIYGFNYRVGRFILGGPSFQEFGRQMRDVFNAMRTDGVWMSLQHLLQVGEEVFWPLVIGSVIVGLLLAVTAYPAAYFLVRRLRAARNRAGTHMRKEQANG